MMNARPPIALLSCLAACLLGLTLIASTAAESQEQEPASSAASLFATEAPVEVVPRAILAVSAYRWEADKVERSVLLVNRGSAPLKILGIDGPRDRVDLKLETLEEGKRFRLSARLRADAPPGQNRDHVTVHTNQGDVTVLLLTFLKTRVYVAPPGIDFGTIDRAQAKADPKLAAYLPETFHVYQYEGKDFRIEVKSSLPFLQLEKTPSDGPGVVVDIPRSGPTAIFDVQVTPQLEQLEPGPFSGMIEVTTNDPDFPKLTVPVRGEVR